MKDDLTYNEVYLCKCEIKRLLETIEKNVSENFVFENVDSSFFTVLAKKIIFFKYLLGNTRNDKYIRIIISDLYYLINSIIQCDTRYMYLNERSIIENYTRMIVGISVMDDHITNNSFQLLKNEMSHIFIDNNEYSIIKNEYAVSCNYVHGGDLLQKELSIYFMDCIQHKNVLKDRSKYYDRIKKLLKVYEKVLIYKYSEYISGCFHRKKAVLEYLIGKANLEYLFGMLVKNK